MLAHRLVSAVVYSVLVFVQYISIYLHTDLSTSLLVPLRVSVCLPLSPFFVSRKEINIFIYCFLSWHKINL